MKEIRANNWLFDGSFENARLWSANLRNTNLTLASLRNADFFKADFREAVLFEADLTGANLTGAMLEGADLTSCLLHNVELTDAIFDENTTLPDGSKWQPGIDLKHFTTSSSTKISRRSRITEEKMFNRVISVGRTEQISNKQTQKGGKGNKQTIE